MNWFGIIIGVSSFLIIGIFHPIVIKCEYYFSKKIWPLFLIGGLIAAIISLLVNNSLGSALLGSLACSLFWSIGELKEQEERVQKGWFPRNPKRTYPFDK
ncbi:MAG: DUF4491 family protein [Lachnospiraceae bacterium]|nr:DUF4491 family protein [Lachnospiraceae bacterium]MDD7026960.1 DUF4491 family protein [Lachnospiraceae bacterium]MDY5700401.1 DUF4491 family protein [Lachnospiraceae bacterium]